MITAPTITSQPTQPEGWECREIELRTDIAGPARFGDPADLSDLEVTDIVNGVVAYAADWHDLAERGMPTPAWRQLASPDSFSGHKLHLACASLDDVRAVLARVFEVVFRAALGCKFAAARAGLEHGKGVVVYLPRRATVVRDASLIAQAMAGFTPERPMEIPGSVRLSGAVWWRHEFGGVDPGFDVYSRSEYRFLYVPASV